MSPVGEDRRRGGEAGEARFANIVFFLSKAAKGAAGVLLVCPYGAYSAIFRIDNIVPTIIWSRFRSHSEVSSFALVKTFRNKIVSGPETFAAKFDLY